ncbi:hypothetical protein [Lentzea sp. NBRC 102530]|uniref:DUF2017 family protein n=1 Tax=Lentzea sp. NBRC 102530 TaxID=3032201 RepID=UPI0024A0599C|nr:hypothetical protein [Lentzea sp. NBRC 102530]GLY46842.1 hypothetical protein Lesp01_04980 [Lentzea sp. NBRC 102530]
MICWDRCGDEVVGYLDEFEVEVLRGYGESLLKLLEHRAGSYESWSGSASIPSTATDDPRILAILRCEIGAAEPDWVLACQEVRCVAEAVRHVREKLTTLPHSGGAVRLTTPQVTSWLKALGWYLASIDAMTDASGVAAGKVAEPTVTWLTGLVSGLRAQSRTGVVAVEQPHDRQR